jgi:hypothetical protein
MPEVSDLRDSVRNFLSHSGTAFKSGGLGVVFKFHRPDQSNQRVTAFRQKTGNNKTRDFAGPIRPQTARGSVTLVHPLA